ncbi:MAG TPA: biotin/lipoyl-containing protein [Candidatus Limnocylindria bacterium]|nr:biotin/lipoyl-containing protein [Candidatus Limnocylindria bacterium]
MGTDEQLGAQPANGTAPADGLPDDEGRRVLSRLADELLPVLIARLEASNLGELELRQEGWRVRLRRPLPVNGVVGGASAPALPHAQGQPATGASRHAAATATAAQAAAGASPDSRPAAAGRAERQRLTVTSPAVGYFVPRDGMGPGSSLRNGDPLGHIDVLGVRQEVVAPADGILSRLEAEAGQAVEYGQTIARLDPDTRESRG